MIDAFQHFKLAACLAEPGGAGLRAGRGGQGVDAYPPVDGVNADVTGFPILKAFAFGGEFGQFVIADLPVLVGRAYAGLNQGPADCTCLGDIYRRAGAGGDAIAEGANDTWIV